jgi:DNA mismatch endonuclease (patch repair protein)
MGSSKTPKRRISLGAGITVPYPEPTSPAASAVGRGNRRRDTRPEVALRSALHRAGLRFRKDYPIRVGTVRARADVVFPRQRVAVFVDGCFWHRCPTHGTRPRRNSVYWDAKLAANVARDRRVDRALREDGWTVVRIWEHETPDAGVREIRRALSRAQCPTPARQSRRR